MALYWVREYLYYSRTKNLFPSQFYVQSHFFCPEWSLCPSFILITTKSKKKREFQSTSVLNRVRIKVVWLQRYILWSGKLSNSWHCVEFLYERVVIMSVKMSFTVTFWDSKLFLNMWLIYKVKPDYPYHYNLTQTINWSQYWCFCV